MRLIDADYLMEQYNLKEATKYGNKDVEQQAHSYSTMMLYEIAAMIEDAPTVCGISFRELLGVYRGRMRVIDRDGFYVDVFPSDISDRKIWKIATKIINEYTVELIVYLE